MKRALTLTGVFLMIMLARWVAFPEQTRARWLNGRTLLNMLDPLPLR